MQAGVNTEATDGYSALQGAHVVRPLNVSEYPPTDTSNLLSDSFHEMNLMEENTYCINPIDQVDKFVAFIDDDD